MMTGNALTQGLRAPVRALAVDAVRWNGRRNLVNQLRKGNGEFQTSISATSQNLMKQ